MEIKKVKDITYQEHYLMNSLNRTEERRETLNKFREKKWISLEDMNQALTDAMMKINANNEDLELHEFNDVICDLKKLLGKEPDE